MIEDAIPRFPDHRTIVTADNIDAVRARLPEDQRHAIAVGCIMWRVPHDVDTWLEPCGSTLTYWPDRRGAVHHDGEVGRSAWGTWHRGELLLDDGLAVDVTGRILHVRLGSTSIETHDREP